MTRSGRLIIVLVSVAVTTMVCGEVIGYEWLNWDDPVAITRNTALTGDARWHWAVTTRLLEHAQPLSWLVWTGTASLAGVRPEAFHAINLVAHLAVTGLTTLLALRWFRAAAPASRGTASLDTWSALIAAAAAATLAGVHPLRMEVVAWVSAAPYAIASALALAALLIWDGRPASRSRIAAASAVYALSCAARPVALGLPVVWIALGWWQRRLWRDAVRDALPAMVVATLAGGAEWMARRPVQLDLPWSYRLDMALTAPFHYGWRLVWPGPSTALDVLPLDPGGDLPVMLAAAAGVVVVCVASWRLRHRLPSLLVVWVSYLALLAPASGLVASGMQARADRYAYAPALVMLVGVAGAMRTLATTRVRLAVVATCALASVTGAALAARATLRPWATSQALWAQAIAVDPSNDMAHYNLATVLATQGHAGEAATHYRTALALNPAHADARANLDRLEAATFEEEGNRLMAQGRDREAIERYAESVRRDPARRHAQGALGMGLASQGRIDDAVPHLREALRLGNTDSAVPAALGALLAEQGDLIGARRVLEDHLRRQPESVLLAHNLARVLATTPGLSADDRQRTVRLAARVVQATGGDDPRTLDTLAEALGAAGRIDESRATRIQAAVRARARGETELAAAIASRIRTQR